MTLNPEPYAARLAMDHPEKLNRFTTFFRVIWIVPIVIILGLLTNSGNSSGQYDGATATITSGGGIVAGLFLATALMIVFRLVYPRWWFDFAQELTRFGARVGAYLFLLTDQYPSTVDAQSVHLAIDYPNVKQDLNRWLPLVKWLLAVPHYVALVLLGIIVVVVSVIAWFTILLTGRYPRGLFNYVVGVGRWHLRVSAYAFLLVTDQYPPFSLK